MAANEKYRMFKNFMINELGITKEDIRDWIKESISAETKNVLETTNIEKMIRDEILHNNFFYDGRLKDCIIDKISKELIKQLNIIVTEQKKTINNG